MLRFLNISVSGLVYDRRNSDSWLVLERLRGGSGGGVFGTNSLMEKETELVSKQLKEDIMVLT